MAWGAGQQIQVGAFYSAGSGNDTPFSEQINSGWMAARGNYVISGGTPSVGASTDLTSAGNHLAIASGSAFVNGTLVTIAASNVDLSGAQAGLASGQSRYVLVTINSSATINATNGSVATTGDQIPPETPENEATLALIYLEYSDTVFDSNQIADFSFIAPNGGYFNGDLIIAKTGGDLELKVNQTDNVAGRDAYISAIAGGSSAGDAYYRAGVSGSTFWTWGLDNSDSDSFLISKSSNLASNIYLKIDTSGNIGFNTTDIEAHGSNKIAIEGINSLLYMQSNVTPFIALASNTWYDGSNWVIKDYDIGSNQGSFLYLQGDILAYYYGTASFTANDQNISEVAGLLINGGAGTITFGQSGNSLTPNFYIGQSFKLTRPNNGVGIATGTEFYLRNASSVETNYASIYGVIVSNTASSEEGKLSFRVSVSGSITDIINVTSAGLLPVTDSTYDLAATGTRFANGYFDAIYPTAIKENITARTITPETDSTYNLAANGTRFANGYLDTLYATNVAENLGINSTIGIGAGTTSSNSMIYNNAGTFQYRQIGGVGSAFFYDYNGETHDIGATNTSNAFRQVSALSVYSDYDNNGTYTELSTTGLQGIHELDSVFEGGKYTDMMFEITNAQQMIFDLQLKVKTLERKLEQKLEVLV